MEKTFNTSPEHRAFTLIELLVVIAVIALLAGLIIPITGAAKRHQILSKSRSELNQVITAIQVYKTKKGFYPPAGTNNPMVNPLYYELLGTKVDANGIYTTLDGAAQINSTTCNSVFFVSGFANSTKGNGDEGERAVNFLGKGLRVGQYLVIPVGGRTVTILGTSVEGPDMLAGQTVGTKINPWRYNSSTPTNNPESFDLWVDVKVGGKTNRICNWRDKPIVL